MKSKSKSYLNTLIKLALLLVFLSSLLYVTNLENAWGERKSAMVVEEKFGVVSILDDHPMEYHDNTNDGALTRSGAKCLNFDDSFDDLVASSGSIYIHMPSKAAGSTFQTFVSKCVGSYDAKRDHSRAVFESESMDYRASVFLENFKHPKLLTSHVETDTPLIRLFEQTPRDALIIYIHREETDRIISALKHIVGQTCYGRRGMDTEYEMKDEEKKCIFNEEAIANLILKPKKQEIGGGASKVMTCRFYEAIDANFPRMVFMNYKQANELQKVLSKHHCPDFETIVNKNHRDSIDFDIFVKLQKDGDLVTMNDWLEAKRDKLEWTFDLKDEQQCRGKTRKMEDDLFSCKDEILQVTRDTSF